MERRTFLAQTCKLCVLGAASLLLPELEGCTSTKVFKTIPVNNTVEVPLSLFETTNLNYVRIKGSYFDIAVQKKENNTFTALLMRCTHQENQVVPTGNGFMCSLHGSTFDKEGKVKKGPAEMPLSQYKVTVVGENVVIQL